MAELKVKIEQLTGAENWPKWKWHIQLQFEQHGLADIIDGTRQCPRLAKEKSNSNEVALWKKENARAASLIASAISQQVAELVLTVTDAKEIWDKLISAYEQSSIQRLSLLMADFFKVKKEGNVTMATYIARVEKLFFDMNYELKKRGSNNIPVELLHGQILATIGQECSEFSNVWESLDDSKRTTTTLIEKLCTIEKPLGLQVAETTDQTSAFAARQFYKPKNRLCYQCGKPGHLARDHRSKVEEKDAFVASNSKGGSVLSAFLSTASVQSDVWICDSGVSNHMILTKQHFVTYDEFAMPMEIVLDNKQTILAFGKGKIDVEHTIYNRKLKGQLVDVYFVPDLGHNLFSVKQAVNHGVTVVMSGESVFVKRGLRTIATGSWSNGCYIMNMSILTPRGLLAANVTKAEDTLQLWHERLGHQDKRHIRKVLEGVGVRVPYSGTSEFCDGCALGKAHRKPSKPRKDKPQNVGDVIHADVNGPMSVASPKGGPAIDHHFWEQPFSQPYFDNSTKREVITTVGQSAYLHCRVRNLGDRAVSWIRKRDLHILTVGILTYTNDQRYQSLHSDGTDEWTLKISSPQIRDSGVYECQVSTEPKISQAFKINVVVSKAKILGNPELYIKSGSDINLTCVVLQTPEPPSFIYWYQGGHVVNYSQRGGINVVTEKQTRTSRLLIAKALPADSGNYTCAPSSSDSASVVVHVLNGEHPAAMQHGNSSSITSALFGNHHALLTLPSLLLSLTTGWFHR